ncbi:TetR/AcrR family transcriptional regulator [Bacillus carboniphilus]|uniref:TetR/AcrR family transcriptional regulator n=1 Tax=Bacillus carboniphilus TaxID=86663 RepID=A0ABY9JW16_9BACI|nr:TetR/AcrR family transcriptional regulator [Bacillus carboniphilus]WLR42662.1 TetR/AcrR family transcriptional regulator [Bacillus carboniphilus]
MDRKQAIIDASVKSFSLFGYKATTMDLVAKFASVGKGTIYTFFKNKEELFLECTNMMVKEMKSEAEAATDPNETFIQNAHRRLYRILEFRREHKFMIKLFQESREIGTPTVKSFIEQLEDTIISYLRKDIEQAMERGEIKDCDPELTAFLILHFYVSLIIDWEKKHQPLKKEEIAELFKLYFLKGLSTR